MRIQARRLLLKILNLVADLELQFVNTTQLMLYLTEFFLHIVLVLVEFLCCLEALFISMLDLLRKVGNLRGNIDFDRFDRVLDVLLRYSFHGVDYVVELLNSLLGLPDLRLALCESVQNGWRYCARLNKLIEHILKLLGLPLKQLPVDLVRR